MIQDPLIVVGLFVSVWVVTFLPSWVLFFKLLAMSASPRGLTWRFWWLLLLYRILIAAPYVVLIITGRDIIPDLIEGLLVGLVVMGALLSLVRFIFRDKIIGFLWWVYGFVYDGLLHYAPYRRLTQAVVTRALAEQPSAQNILELGCGTGNVLKSLREEYPSARLTGVDSSSSMLGIARKKPTNSEIVREDLLAFLHNQKDNHYDLLVMQNVLYVVEKREILWKEIDRVLTSNGVVVITNSDTAGSGTITKEHLKYGKWYELLHPKLLCVGIIDAFISQLSRSGSFHFISEEQIRSETSEYFDMSPVDRVYGDVNILFTLIKQDHAR